MAPATSSPFSPDFPPWEPNDPTLTGMPEEVRLKIFGYLIPKDIKIVPHEPASRDQSHTYEHHPTDIIEMYASLLSVSRQIRADAQTFAPHIHVEEGTPGARTNDRPRLPRWCFPLVRSMSTHAQLGEYGFPMGRWLAKDIVPSLEWVQTGHGKSPPQFVLTQQQYQQVVAAFDAKQTTVTLQPGPGGCVECWDDSSTSIKIIELPPPSPGSNYGGILRSIQKNGVQLICWVMLAKGVYNWHPDVLNNDPAPDRPVFGTAILVWGPKGIHLTRMKDLRKYAQPRNRHYMSMVLRLVAKYYHHYERQGGERSAFPYEIGPYPGVQPQGDWRWVLYPTHPMPMPTQLHLEL